MQICGSFQAGQSFVEKLCHFQESHKFNYKIGISSNSAIIASTNFHLLISGLRQTLGLNSTFTKTTPPRGLNTTYQKDLPNNALPPANNTTFEVKNNKKDSRSSSQDIDIDIDRLSSTSDSSMSHRLNDLGDVQHLARMQEESKYIF